MQDLMVNENKSTRSVGSPSCPVCAESLKHACVACKSCDTPHHSECWTYAGKCAIFACGSRKSDKYELTENTSPTIGKESTLRSGLGFSKEVLRRFQGAFWGTTGFSSAVMKTMGEDLGFRVSNDHPLYFTVTGLKIKGEGGEKK